MSAAKWQSDIEVDVQVGRALKLVVVLAGMGGGVAGGLAVLAVLLGSFVAMKVLDLILGRRGRAVLKLPLQFAGCLCFC